VLLKIKKIKEKTGADGPWGAAFNMHHFEFIKGGA
jgi:hypothetical protein